MKNLMNSFFVSYMITTLISNFFLNLVSNQGEFSLNMFLFTTALTTSFYFIGILIKKICFAFLQANKENREYRKIHPNYEEPW